MQCNLRSDQSERMLEALYGESDAASQRQFEGHLAECATCHQEWDDLRQLRPRLAAWKVPEFGRVQARAYARPSPLWRLAAAAVLLVAAGSGLGLAGVELRRDEQGWSLRVGHGSDDQVARLLAEQEVRHEQRLRAFVDSRSVAPAPVASDTKALLDEVRRLIRDSEAHQGERMVALVAAARERTETQRRVDMARMAYSLSYLDGQTGQHMARTTELVGYMLDASHQPQR